MTEKNTTLPPSQQYCFPKKDASIHWTIDEEMNLVDFAVYDNCTTEREKRLNNIIQILKIRDFTYGNYYSDWEECELLDVLLNILKYFPSNEKVLKKIYRELGKIDEWKEKLAPFNNYYWKSEND